ncbi:hypothetical protein GGR53DRAFT_463310 [Hypoxylon sp. FL1150]|nr:hypothetical protein GGR53DRAFT_463310 [Hypoxylon sp. FL1150]
MGRVYEHPGRTRKPKAKKPENFLKQAMKGAIVQTIMAKKTKKTKKTTKTKTTKTTKTTEKHDHFVTKKRYCFDPKVLKRSTLDLSPEKYSCQMSTLIILNARSFGTPRIVEGSDSQHTLDIDQERLALSIIDFFDESDQLLVSSSKLATLEERLISALQILQANRVHYPISVATVKFTGTNQPNSPLSLYLPYNKKAEWASDKLPPTWKADQISQARCLFRIPKLMGRCATTTGLVSFNVTEQRDLTTYIKNLRASSHHVALLVTHVETMTIELAAEVLFHLTKKQKVQIARVFFESLLGPRQPLSRVRVHHIMEDYRVHLHHNLQVRIIERGDKGMEQELEDEALRLTPDALKVFVCCRAEIARLAGDDDESEWWRMAENVIEEFGPRDSDINKRVPREPQAGLGEAFDENANNPIDLTNPKLSRDGWLDVVLVPNLSKELMR